MEKFKVSFEANNQQLKSIGTKHASDTYADIEATFVLGEKWTDMDSVSAVWWNDFTRVATVLDSQGKCIVPHEVLTRKGCVRVNLVGSIVEGDELITRLTSYSAEAVQVNEKIKLTGSETSEITPSQYEQFVANVKADADRAEAGATASANSADEAEASAQNASESASASAVSASDSARSATASAGYAQNAKNSATDAETAKEGAESARDKILGMRATAETLEAGSDATASYSDGLLTLGIPRGDRGEQGIQGETGATPNLTIGAVETLAPTEDATATITGTAEEPILNLGIPKGDTGEVSLEDLEALLPTDTASGDIVSIPDGQSVVPVKSLKVTLEPIQDLHGYDKPWSGGNGDNKGNFVDGYSINPQGEVISYTGRCATVEPIPIDANTTYYVKRFGNVGAFIYAVFNGNTLVRRTADVATGSALDTSGGDKLYVCAYDGTIDNIKPMVTKGSLPTTYTPYSNICPISGHTECVTERTGKNLLSPTLTDWSAVGTYFHINDVVPKDVTARLTFVDKDTSVDMTNIYFGWVYEDVTAVSATKYKWCVDGNSLKANTVNQSDNSGTSVLCRNLMIYPKTETAFNKLFSRYDIQVELGSSATSYEPYETPTTYTTSLGRTVYGGTLDVVSGELVVDRAMVTFSDSTAWSVTVTSGHYRAYTYALTDILPWNDNRHATTTMICDRLPTGSWEDVFVGAAVLGQINKAIGFGTDSLGITDGTSLGAWLANNPLTICYELATPQTYQLDPQTIDLLLGDNNLWTDCGSVEVTYKADVGLYIDKKLSSNGTRSLSMGLTKSATVEAETEAEPFKTETETKTEEAETETE